MTDLTDLYAPRPEGDDRGGGYRIRSDATWDMAREAYLDGASSSEVCARFDLCEGTFRARAKKGEWRRCDQDDPEPVGDGPVADWALSAGDDLDSEADYGELADHALRQLRRAMARGRASAASSWMRLHERLSLKAEATARKAHAAANPPPPPSALFLKAEAALAARRQELVGRFADDDGTAALARAAAIASRVEGLTRRMLALDPRDGIARAALDADRMRLEREIGSLGPVAPDADPDDPDDSDPFFIDPSPG